MERESLDLERINLKKIREAKGLSQAELSRRSGVSQSYISEVEKGIKNVRVQILIQLAEALECHFVELLKMKEEDNEK